jgi:hypothetical protein
MPQPAKEMAKLAKEMTQPAEEIPMQDLASQSSKMPAPLREPFTAEEIEKFFEQVIRYVQKESKGSCREDVYKNLNLADYLPINAHSTDTGTLVTSYYAIKQYRTPWSSKNCFPLFVYN